MPPRKGTEAYNKWRNSPAYAKWCANQAEGARKQWVTQDRKAVAEKIKQTRRAESPEKKERFKQKCREREARQDYPKRTKKYRETYYGTGDLETKREQSRINGRKSHGREDRDNIQAEQKRRWSDPEKRRQHGLKVKAAWAKKTPEERAAWSEAIIKARPNEGPNKGELQLLSLCPSVAQFTGDRKYLIRMTGWTSGFKNPDFIIRPIEKTKKVIELFGGRDYWHTETEADQLIEAYQASGYECLIVWYDEMRRDPIAAQAAVTAFVGA